MKIILRGLLIALAIAASGIASVNAQSGRLTSMDKAAKDEFFSYYAEKSRADPQGKTPRRLDSFTVMSSINYMPELYTTEVIAMVDLDKLVRALEVQKGQKFIPMDVLRIAASGQGNAYCNETWKATTEQTKAFERTYDTSWFNIIVRYHDTYTKERLGSVLVKGVGVQCKHQFVQGM